MSSRVLAVLEGPVELRAQGAAGGWCLSGVERGTAGTAVAVCFIGAQVTLPTRPPRTMEIRELTDARASRSWQIDADGEPFAVRARAVQVHRSAARAFQRALPPLRASFAARLGWGVLLTMLRVPGVAALLARRRS